MKTLKILILAGTALLSACASLHDREAYKWCLQVVGEDPQHKCQFNPREHGRAFIDMQNAALYATLTPRSDIKEMLLSDDIDKVRAGISAFRWTPEGEARFLTEVAMAYGPLCAGTGLTPGTPDFAQCLIYRYESDQNRRQSARDTQAVRNQINSLRQMQSRPISCNPNIFGGFDCN